VVIAAQPFEVTTLREDVETFGRKAKVSFGRDWVRDAQRRDFTINALSMSRDGTLHDHVGGLEDVQARRVRFIGDARARIAEDYLRILRFFRFHAAYGDGPPDHEGLAACIEARAGLETLSRERVRMELLKLLPARHAVPVLAVMAEAGLLVTLLGGVPLLASLSNLAKAEAASGLQADPVRRLGALGVLVTEDAERLADRLRLSNAEQARLAVIGAYWHGVSAENGQAGRALLYRLGPDLFLDTVLVAWSRSPQGIADHHWQALVHLPREWIIPVFPLKAADFIARGIEKGPPLGAALTAAETAWIAADFPMDDAAVRAIADQVAQK
jgi:poly(A) polymerase